MLSNLWARITGKDKRGQVPVQQAVSLNRPGDYVIAHPYGLYTDAPNDQLSVEVRPGVLLPVVTVRPTDSAQGEPVFFHPTTNSRIIARNNGDLDVIVEDEEGGTPGNLNIICVKANITASDSVNITGDTNIDGALSVTGDAAIGGDANITGDSNAAEHTSGAISLTTHKHVGSPTAPLGPVSPTGTPTP